jgi:two-component system CheB/CheR fusion protein
MKSIAPGIPTARFENNKRALAAVVNEALMEELGYTLICVDEHNEVIQTFGDTTKYLLQKNFTTNITELLPKPLAIAFATAARKAEQSNEKVLVKGIGIEQNPFPVNLLVKALEIKKSSQKLLLVAFSDDSTANIFQQQQGEVFDKKIYLDEYVLNMEEELRGLKEELRLTYEKLEASDENMQSFNEELLSANEEMQSTNEEMQSINEELHTINADYQAKNNELIEINDDLNNYFRSNVNGQLFVNRDILLMKFSPGTVQHINLKHSDIGRPLSNISTNIKFETIIADIKEVITYGGVITKEVEAVDSRWYQIMTMPYVKQADNTTDGAIITFNDITTLKKMQLELDKKNKSLLEINADLDNFVLSASHDLLGPLGNIEVTISLVNQLKIQEPELLDYLNVINNSVNKFRVLINELSAIGKIESEAYKMDAVNVDELMEEVILSINNRISTTKTTITTDFQVKQIVFSQKNLRSILFNLISNAIKFAGKQPPRIHIATKHEEAFVVLSVKDNGIGMTLSETEKIFTKYKRINENVEGQGIGLYLVNKIVNTAGGKVMVESEPGRGSTFKIYLKSDPLVIV